MIVGLDGAGPAAAEAVNAVLALGVRFAPAQHRQKSAHRAEFQPRHRPARPDLGDGPLDDPLRLKAICALWAMVKEVSRRELGSLLLDGPVLPGSVGRMNLLG